MSYSQGSVQVQLEAPTEREVLQAPQAMHQGRLAQAAPVRERQGVLSREVCCQTHSSIREIPQALVLGT
jgi:hypothetical protein